MIIRQFSKNNLVLNSIIFGVIIAILGGIVTSIIIGINLKYILTLTAGITLGSLNTFFLDLFTKYALDRGHKLSVLLSSYIRLLVFAVLFYFSITRFGNVGGLGAGIGYLASYVGIMISAAVMPKNNPVCIYENATNNDSDNLRYFFVKSFEMVKYNNGRTFVTHKLFKKVKKIENA